MLWAYDYFVDLAIPAKIATATNNLGYGKVTSTVLSSGIKPVASTRSYSTIRRSLLMVTLSSLFLSFFLGAATITKSSSYAASAELEPREARLDLDEVWDSSDDPVEELEDIFWVLIEC